MKVVWHNPNAPNKSDGHWAVPCGVCGKELLPFNHLCVYEIMVGWTMAGYDQPFFICSEECNSKAVAGILKQKRLELNKAFAVMYDIKMPKWYREILDS